jgi:F0F1-type ATP synthase membrane subunit b/b'
MSKLFGDAGKASKPLRRFKPTEFQTSGAQLKNLPSERGTARIALEQTPLISRQLGQISSGAQQAAGELGALREQVAPGFGRLTEAGSAAIQNQRSRAISNLRENLGRRRVLGSSFGEDALARAEAEFGQQEAQFRSQAALQEIEASRVLSQQQFETSVQGSQSIINQANFETGLAAQLSNNISQSMAGLAKAEAGIRADKQGAIGALGTAAITGIGTALGGPLGGAAGAAIAGSVFPGQGT